MMRMKNNADDLPSILDDNFTNVEQSETHSDTENAFDFDQKKNRKTEFSKDLYNRKSRIGDFLRNSWYERDKKSNIVHHPSDFIISPEKPLDKIHSSEPIKEEDQEASMKADKKNESGGRIVKLIL